MANKESVKENLYVITDHVFPSDSYGTDDYLGNWPMLYILENGNKVYIGESTNVAERMKQYYNNHEKREFNQVHFIYSEKFNQFPLIVNAGFEVLSNDVDTDNRPRRGKEMWVEVIARKNNALMIH